LRRDRRQNEPVIVGTIVGYTNAGKSSLMNALTDADVFVEDKLFATLDPTTRHISLPNKTRVLLTDTVGFIRKLPHQLVSAFRATLEEVLEADFLVHVVDVSAQDFEVKINTAHALLDELNAAGLPTLFVFNKIDKINPNLIEELLAPFTPHVVISVRKKQGFDALFSSIQDLLEQHRKVMTFKLPYSRMDIVNLLHTHGKLIRETYETDIEIEVEINAIIGEKIMGQLYRS